MRADEGGGGGVSAVRVVAGTARGRPLVAPPGTATRPTTDRVRGAVFNALYSLGGVDGWAVFDAFAGSGGLGIEALSRGAARATFVERERAALDAVHRNVGTLGFGDVARVVPGDAHRLLGAADPRVRGPWDLVLLDPPYDFDGWDRLLGDAAPLLGDDGLVVCESARQIALAPGWRLVREKVYGGTVVTITRRAATDTRPGPTAVTLSTRAAGAP